MRAEIVSIGTELLLGTITDTNASYLAQRLAALGIDCYYVSQVGDNLDRLVETLGRAWGRSGLTITTGGLGPTGDDLTREAVSSLLGEEMRVDPGLESDLRGFFARRGVEMPERNLKQATLIPSARLLPNPIGTAPGWWVRREEAGGERSIVSMPGVPYEMKRMWEVEVEPRLRERSDTIIASRTLKILGLGESTVEDMVHDLMAGTNPTLAPYAKQDGVHLRITAKAADAAAAREVIAELERSVRSRLGSAVYGADDDTPHGVARDLLRDLGYSYALLEVGGAAAGALSSLVGRSGEEPAGDKCLGNVSVEQLPALVKIVGTVAEWADGATLQSAAAYLKSHTSADVVLGVSAELKSAGSDTGVAMAEAEIVLLGPGGSGEEHVTRTRHSWRTEPNEVRRLLALAAYNLLRLYLLKRKGQEGH